LRAAKAYANKKIVENAACKNKELWKVVKEIENGNEINMGGNKLLQLVLEDKSIMTNEEIVNKLNEFFVNVGTSVNYVLRAPIFLNSRNFGKKRDTTKKLKSNS